MDDHMRIRRLRMCKYKRTEGSFSSDFYILVNWTALIGEYFWGNFSSVLVMVRAKHLIKSYKTIYMICAVIHVHTNVRYFVVKLLSEKTYGYMYTYDIQNPFFTYEHTSLTNQFCDTVRYRHLGPSPRFRHHVQCTMHAYDFVCYIYRY